MKSRSRLIAAGSSSFFSPGGNFIKSENPPSGLRALARFVLIGAVLGPVPARAARRWKPDPALVSWEQGLEAGEKFRFPFVSEYRHGGKRLVYVAGDHTNGGGSPNLKTVKAAFDALAPQAVLVEGFRTTGDFSYRSIDLERFARDDFKSVAESPYALTLAGRAGLPARGGEPFDRDLRKALMKEGRPVQDALGFLLIRMIPGWRRDASLASDAAFEEMAAGYLERERGELGVKERFGMKELRAWYAEKAPNGPPLREIAYRDLAPVPGPAATPLQTLAFAVDQAREARFLSQLESLLSRYDRVLVVYGGSHLCRERRVLRPLLGAPRDSKPF